MDTHPGCWLWGSVFMLRLVSLGSLAKWWAVGSSLIFIFPLVSVEAS